MKITFLGDIMCKATMLSSYQNTDGSYDFTPLFQNVHELLSESSLVCGNLETPISHNREDYSKELYCFCSPIELANAAKSAGINLVFTANNHCLDRGVSGLDETIKCLDEVGLYHTGVFCKKNVAPLVVDVEGIRIGFMSYTYGTNAFSNHCYLKKSEYWRVNLFQNQELSSRLERFCKNTRFVNRLYSIFLKITHNPNYSLPIYERRERRLGCRRELIKSIRTMYACSPDIIVMSMHTGGQYNNVASNDTRALTEYLLSHGVNVVAGTHEHVVHGGTFERQGSNKIATYSLGNFDGTAGVYDKPFDKMSEYSIAWHVYIDKICEKVSIVKTSFSILKSLKLDGCEKGITVYPVYDLIINSNDDSEKEQLLHDLYEIGKRFSGHDISNLGVMKEYEL